MLDARRAGQQRGADGSGHGRVRGDADGAATARGRGRRPIDYGYQWQRCDGQGKSCKNIAGATAGTYVATADDVGATLRVVVSAGNWISSVSQASVGRDRRGG